MFDVREAEGMFHRESSLVPVESCDRVSEAVIALVDQFPAHFRDGCGCSHLESERVEDFCDGAD